jgi:hypothetical protein
MYGSSTHYANGGSTLPTRRLGSVDTRTLLYLGDPGPISFPTRCKVRLLGIEQFAHKSDLV